MISELRLQHFRSYEDATFTFGPGVNIIVGPNASGKTNLLEGILVTARGASYRAKDQELIGFDQPWTRLDATTAAHGQRTVKITAVPAGKSYELAGKPYKRLTLPQTLPVVLFEPNHLTLLHGSPQNRRSYLDDLIEQLTPGYSPLRRHYQRTLAQRNALLKRAHKPSNEELFPWNLRLSELGAAIARARHTLAGQINQPLQTQYRAISNTAAALSLSYHLQFGANGYETALLQQLEQDLAVDKLRGFTASGPHREDFTVFFGDYPAAETASRGETRSAVLALKIIELQLLEQIQTTPPILLLDDVFSELDTTRRAALTAHLEHYQTFITTTDADSTVQNFNAKARLLSLL